MIFLDNMKRLFCTAVFILFVFTPNAVHGGASSFLFTALDVADQVFNILDRVKQSDRNPRGPSNEKIFGVLSKQIVSVSEKLDQEFNKVFKKLDKLPQDIIFLTDRKTLSDNYKIIQTNAAGLIRDQARMNRNRFKIPNSPSISDPWLKVHNLITNENFFTRLSPNWGDYYHEQREGVCQTNMSNLQLIYILIRQYLTIATEYYISGHILLNIQNRTREIQKIETPTNYENDLVDLFEERQSQMIQDLAYFIEIMKETSRDYWTCNQKDYNPNNPWFKEVQAFTSYFTVKENIPVPCDESCSHFKITTCKSRYDKGLCTNTRLCPNELVSCQMYPEGLNFCVNSNNHQTYRRYEFVAPYYGKKASSCKLSIGSNDDQVFSLPAGIRKKLGKNARYFRCICHENRFVVNTAPVVAEPGSIIIGAKLTVSDNMLKIEAMQGQLHDEGYIDNEKFTGPSNSEARKNIYETLNWNDEIDLSPMTVPENHVITGLQIEKTGNRFYLRLQSVEVNFNTQNRSNPARPYPRRVWHEKKNFGTKEFTFRVADRPTKSPNITESYHSNADQFVKFNVTGMWEDGGQTTIPFIDTQWVTPYPFTPLSGASLYVRGQNGYGGFLGIKVQTFNVIPYVKMISDLDYRVRDIQSQLESL